MVGAGPCAFSGFYFFFSLPWWEGRTINQQRPGKAEKLHKNSLVLRPGFAVLKLDSVRHFLFNSTPF